jgi:hypothetical protein
MSRSVARLLYWSPRILAIVFAFLLSLFALDVFNEAHGFWHTSLALLVHLIPALVVVAVLLASWRWEWMGAGLFTLAAIFYAWMVLPMHINWAVTVAIPLLVIGALFLANWIERAKLRSAL